MAKEGEDLEKLVEACHGLIEPDTAEVKWNDHADGKLSKIKRQIDISVKDKSNPEAIDKIIECKDYSRPLNVNSVIGLEGNREDIGANSAIEVTTIGYSTGALNYANAKGIDLRVIEKVDPEELKWLQLREINSEMKMGNFLSITINPVNKIHRIEPVELKFNQRVFKFKKEDKRVSINEIWKALPPEHLKLIFQDMKPGDPKIRRTLDLDFVEGNPLYYYQNRRSIELQSIILDAEIWIHVKKYPLLLTRVYRNYVNDKEYMDIAEFEFEHDGQQRILQLLKQPMSVTEASKIAIRILHKPAEQKSKSKKHNKKHNKK